MGAQEKKSVKRHRRHNLKERFEIVKTLGQGTYGKVKLAVEKSSRTKYAIKSIRKNKIETEQDLIRVRREIEIMATLNHPNITMVHEVFENKDRIVLVIEYAEGGELYDYINERQGLYEDEARKFFRQITAAVHYLHSNGVVHRDLKLENILLDGCGNVKIADFGLSNVYGDNKLLNTFCGSPLYASPEIVNGQPYCGPEVDCWSLGVVLYTLVYGAMPFDGSDFKKLKHQITHGDYFEPRNPSDASGLIRQLLCTSVPGRATVSDICSHWWVNFGFDHSPAQIAPAHQGVAVDQSLLHDALKIPYSSAEDSDTELAQVVATETTPAEERGENTIETVTETQLQEVVTPKNTETAVCSSGSSNSADSSTSAINSQTHHETPSSSNHSHNVLTSQQPLKGILKKPRPRRNSQGSAEGGASKDLVKDIPKKRRPQSDCFVDATWLDIAPDSHLNDVDLNIPSKPVFDSTKKPKRGILKNKNGNSSQGSNNGNQHSRSDSGCVIDEQLNLYSALEKFEVALPVPSPRTNENQRDSAYGGDSRKPSCDSEPLSQEQPNIYGFAEIENVLDQIVNFDVVQIQNNTKCSSSNSSGHGSQPFSRPESGEFDQTPNTSGELLDQTDSPKTEPIRYRKKPLKSILKRNSKSKKDSWRYSLGSQGSNSSADILDFSYDSCDGDHFMQEYCTVPIPLNDEGDAKPQNTKQGDHWSEFEVLSWQGKDAPLNDSMQLANEDRNSGNFTGKSIEHLVQVVEKLESDTNQLSGSRPNSDSEMETSSPTAKDDNDDYHDYANVPYEVENKEEASVSQEESTETKTDCVQTPVSPAKMEVNLEAPPPPLPERPPPIGAPASPSHRPDTPPPLPETPPPPFKTHELDLFEFDMLEFEQTASELSSRESTVQLESLDGLLGEMEGCGDAHADVALMQATSNDVMMESLDVVDTDKHRLSDLIADLQECAAEGSEGPAEVIEPESDEHLIKPLPDSEVNELPWFLQSADERRSKVKRQWSVPTDLLKTDVEKFSIDKSVPVELASPEFLQCIDVYNLEIAAYFNEKRNREDCKAEFIPINSCCHSDQTTTECSNQTVAFDDVIARDSSCSESEASSEDEAGAGELPQLFIEEENLNGGCVPDVNHFDDVATLFNENCDDCGGEEGISLNTQVESELHNFVNDFDMNQTNLVISATSPEFQRKNGHIEIPTHTFDALKDDVSNPIEQTKVSLDEIMRRIDLLGAKIDTELQSTTNMQSDASPYIDHNEATEVCRQAIEICQKLN